MNDSVVHQDQNDIPTWFGLDPSVAERREWAEIDLALVRWLVLATMTLYLVFSGRAAKPALGWCAIGIGVVSNAALEAYRRHRRIAVPISIALHMIDTTMLLVYVAAFRAGLTHYLPLYTTMLILGAIRFGLGGIVVSSMLGLVISVLVLLGPNTPDSTSTLAVMTGTIVVDAALLGYFAYLGYRQYLHGEQRETQLRQRISEITVLHEVSSTAHDLKSEDALQNIVEIVTKFMGFQRAGLFLTENVGEMIPHRYHSYRHGAQESGLTQLDMVPDLFSAVLQGRQPIVIDGSQGCTNMDSEPCVQIAVPLHSDAGPLGVLVADSNDRRETSRSDMKMLANLARSAIVAIENASLHQRVKRMANHDGVTDLYNHRYFQERLREMLASAQANQSLSLLMVEIDQFKRYNDSFGHRQGDTALYCLSRALEQSSQALDGLVARYGGDEFVIILPQVGRGQALHVARQIRDQVYGITTRMLAQQDLPPVMLSIGVATFPDDAQTAPNLIEAADQAMYIVKHSGGNKVNAYSGSTVTLSQEVQN
jgi:diguanylate cyclase (GGDEF)-like protein